jgi:hypothetical protein
MGASLETNSFGAKGAASTLIDLAKARIFAATGKNVSIYQQAISGANTSSLTNTQWPAVKAETPSLPGGGKTLVIFAAGGNDTTGQVPLTPGAAKQTTARDATLAIISEIEAKGWDWCQVDLTWRDYNLPNCRYDKTQGTWIWVQEVDKTINLNRTRPYRSWVQSDGSCWANGYAFVRNNRQNINQDGIHFNDPLMAMWRNFLCDYAFIPAITGVAPPIVYARDEAYPLVYSMSAAAYGNSIQAITNSTHQGASHVAVYSSGSTPTAAEVLSGTGAGFVSKLGEYRVGTTIDNNVRQTINGLASSTAYVVCAVFINDANITSAVKTANVTTAAATLTSPILVIYGTSASVHTPTNINVLRSNTANTNLINRTGASTGIGIKFNTNPVSSQGYGNTTLSVGPEIPVDAITTSSYIASTAMIMEISGLTVGKAYVLTMASGSNVTDLNDSVKLADIGIVLGTIIDGGPSVRTYNSYLPPAIPATTVAGNVSFAVQPDATGKIQFSVVKNPAANYGHISAFLIAG